MIRKGTRKFAGKYYKHGYTVKNKTAAKRKRMLLQKEGYKVRTSKLKHSIEIYYY